VRTSGVDELRALGFLGLASRLRRLGERLQQEVSEVYEARGLQARARWFPLLHLLSSGRALAVSEVAQRLGLTHTAVRQAATPMERAGLLRSGTAPDDRRRRLLRLTPAGIELAARLGPLWREVEAATRVLVTESGQDLLGALDALEDRLAERSMRERLGSAGGVEIVPFRRALAPAFAALNYAWLERDFAVEPRDRELLEDPEGSLVDRGGEILFALLDGAPVGTCALLPHGDGILELAKMAVAESHRRRGIGHALTSAAIARARARGVRTLFLLTSVRLAPAVALYRSFGFREVARAPAVHVGYARPSIVLQLDLDTRQGGTP
jgi:ribosomal protein S18 acetylase RimI-like enzyme/DNA-binding transcriptional ArsR family regulator